MTKLTNKAFTVVELIITFSIVMTISLGLFKVVDSYREKQQQESHKKEINSYIDEIVKVIKDDFLKKEIKTINGLTLSGCNQALKIEFNNSSKELCVSNDYIEYGGIKYQKPSKFIVFEDDFILEKITDNTEKPIYDKIVEDSSDASKLIVPTITKETHYSIKIKLKHTELKGDFNILVSTTSRNKENKKQEWATDINGDFIKEIIVDTNIATESDFEYKFKTSGMSNVALTDKYIHKIAFKYTGQEGTQLMAEAAKKIIISDSIISMYETPLVLNDLFTNYLKNNKIEEINIPGGMSDCDLDAKPEGEEKTCSTTYQIDITQSGSNSNLSNLNKFSIKNNDVSNYNGETEKGSFYNIKLTNYGYLDELDLRDDFGSTNQNVGVENIETKKTLSIPGVQFPFAGLEIGNIYIKELDVSETGALNIILNGYRSNGTASSLQDLIDGTYYYISKPLSRVNNLVIVPDSEGTLNKLPPALKEKVNNLILSDKVTNVSVSNLKDYGIKAIRYQNDVLDGISLDGFSCNSDLNKCTYTG